MASESCGNPAADNDATMDRRPKYDKSKVCIKCKVNSGNIVIRHAVYCKECFPALLSSKVKRSLDGFINAKPGASRRKYLKASGDLCIGLSGGLGSTVLLDLISSIYFLNHDESQTPKQGELKPRGGKDHPRNEPVWKKASVCYVEIANGFPGMKDRTEEVRRVVEERYEQFEFVPVRLEDAFDKNWWNRVGGMTGTDVTSDLTSEDLYFSTLSDESSSDPVQKLRSYISALPTQTAIPSAISTLTRLLLLHTAHFTQSSHLLLGTSLTSLSITLVSSISQGGGFSVREEAQEEWTTANSGRTVRLIRPLQEITMKECSVWAWWNNLVVVGREKYPGGKQGIGALTKDFIVGLERDYPSTVSTIARTCAKLAPKVGAGGLCILCERPLQPGVQEWKSRISIRSTREPPPAPLTDNDPVLQSLTPHLCYSCHTTLTSRSSRSVSTATNTSIPFPLWVSTHLERSASAGSGSVDARIEEEVKEAGGEVWATRKVGQEDMKAAIGDFLLE